MREHTQRLGNCIYRGLILPTFQFFNACQISDKTRAKFKFISKMKAAFVLLLSKIIDAAIMSIDFGTEWMKIGLVKPGIPFDVVLNRDSKRKTQTIITIRGDERTYSTNGQNLVHFVVYFVGCSISQGYFSAFEITGFADL